MKKYVPPTIHNYGNLSILIQLSGRGPRDVLFRHQLL
jgi:hypothetical protein